MTNTYAEMSLSPRSEQTILRQVLANSGFEYSGPRLMLGLSGLEHQVDAVGLRGDNLALVLSGPKDLGLRPEKSIHTPSPKFKSEVWCRDALLRMYDISATLQREGLTVDLVLFENRLTQSLPGGGFGGGAIQPWVAEHGLPNDWLGTWQSSVYDIDVPSMRYLSETGQSAGACYLGLNDLTLHEIADICSGDEARAQPATRSAMSRVRVDQYFNPPTDELILTALALSKRHDTALIKDIYDVATALQHAPVENVVVPATDYTDPVATARELAKIGAVDYTAEIRLEENGRQIIHRVTKTAQENFVIRALKVLDLPGIVKSLVHGFRGHE
jgi:hypothetical protein